MKDQFLKDTKCENTKNQSCNMISLQTEEEGHRLEDNASQPGASLKRGRRIIMSISLFFCSVA